MADKAEKPKHKKKREPHKIITTKAKDGSYGHEHVFEGSDRPVFAGTSRDMDDLKQHMEDHFGGGPAEAEEEAEEQPAASADNG